MNRIKEKELLTWYKNKSRKPLIVWGARQVGKTYLVLDLFARRYFKNFVYIDLKKEKDSADYFSTTCNPDDYLHYIEAKFGKKVSKDVPLIFDEVQVCLNVLTSLKYFCQDHREIPVIATGSMVRLSLRDKNGINAEEFLFPVGKVNSIKVYPLTFEEYLINSNKVVYDDIRKAFVDKVPMKEPLHKIAMDLLHEYLVIGGMPEVVDTFLKNKSYVDAKKILSDVYGNYLGDMSSFNISNETILKTRNVYRNIFRQLNKENKNFKVTQVEKGKSNRDYFSAYQWLELAGLVYRSKNTTGKISLPIAEESQGLFRLYLSDEGIFTYQSEVPDVDFFVSDKRNTLAGVFYENYVAEEFVAKGIPLYYWTGKSTHEFEFIVFGNGALHVIDVKKGRGRTESLKEFREKNGNAVFVKISSNNFGFDKENNMITIPHYAVFALADVLSSN